jgi:hypothetical protein
MKTLRRLATIGLLLALPSGRAPALDPITIGEHVTLSVSDRMRGEFVSWFDPAPPNSNGNYNFFANRLRFGALVSYPSLEVFVEGQDTRLVNLPGADSNHATVGPLGPGAAYFANTKDRDQGEVFLHRAYATARNFGLAGVALRAGRVGYNMGLEKPPKHPALAWLQTARISQRLIGNFDYTNVGRSFDGVQLLYDRGPLNLTLMASHPTSGGFNVNANKTIDDIDLVSAVATLTEPAGVGPLSAQAFYIYYGDRRDLTAADNRAKDPPPGALCASGDNRRLFRSCDTQDIAVHTLGGNVTHLIPAGPGTIDLLGWTAVQWGDWETLDHYAWAWATEAGYQLPEMAGTPWLRVGFFRSSGDDNPTNEDHNTFFQIIPTARVYALFPFYNLMNNQDVFVQGVVRPFTGFSAAVTGHYLRATEGADLAYSGGGATSGDFFGFAGIRARNEREFAYLTDLELSYTFNKHLSVYAFYGHAFGQGIVSANYSQGDDADYAYVETTVSF